MIARNKFNHLNIKQKIYKIASSMRSLEDALKKREESDPTELYAYISYIEKDRDHKKIQACFDRISQYRIDSLEALEPSLKIKNLNFCYHELLDLINESISEKFYSVKHFDSGLGMQRFEVAAILDNIRSPFNVGNMFRSADCLGTGELALCGITPHPPSVKIDRTAMGTIDVTKWRYFEKTGDAISYYKDLGYQITALETVQGSVSLKDYDIREKTAFIFGNEEFGITDEILRRADDILELPMVGSKNSMNVANSFAIVFYQVMEKFRV